MNLLAEPTFRLRPRQEETWIGGRVQSIDNPERRSFQGLTARLVPLRSSMWLFFFRFRVRRGPI